MQYEKRRCITEYTFIMAAGCLLGILCFAMIYGLKIVNPCYDAWIFHGDMDLQQHYVGFCHFRNTPWQFPIGLIDSLSVPYSMSVVYTDSIPLFAIIFKLFNNILPVHFQYFGIFGLISFMLMGLVSPVLIRRFCKSKIVCVFGSIFFIISFPILQRLFYHTALSAQWIIVLALIIWFYTDITDREQLKKICTYWTLMGVLSVLIHSYFVFMTGLILLAQIADGLYKSYGHKDIKNKLYLILPLICMGISSFAMLYILGGFYGAGSVSGDGFGSFDANLSALINPLEYSNIFSGFALYGMFEFEGFAYLGAGIILLTVVCVIYSANKKHTENKIKSMQSEMDGEESVSEDRINHSAKMILFALSLLCFLFACFPNYTFGGIKLFSVPLPGIVISLLGICRTNARFMWIPMYIIIVSVLWCIGSMYDKKWIKILFALAVILQLYEMSSMVKKLNYTYTTEYETNSVWDEIESGVILADKDQFVFMYDDSDIMMDTAFCAYLNNMSQNSFYYARTIYDEIDAEIARWSEEFLKGNIDSKAVYIFRNSDYSDEFRNIVSSVNAKEYLIDGHVIIIR